MITCIIIKTSKYINITLPSWTGLAQHPHSMHMVGQWCLRRSHSIATVSPKAPSRGIVLVHVRNYHRYMSL